MKSSALVKTIATIVAFFLFQCSFATIYYVSPDGDDTFGDGSAASPWRTLQYAVSHVPAAQSHTIQLAAGTFIENGPIEVPIGVNIEGTGIDVTIIKANPSFYYHPADPGFALDKFLIRLNNFTNGSGDQTLKNFTVDGDLKQLHGGIYIHGRNNIIVDSVKVQATNFNGIWLWESKVSKITNSTLINCSWGSTSYSSGALNLGNLEDVEIANVDVDEDTGYGMKAIGPDGVNNFTNLVIHDSHVSVNPFGLWNDGQAPNIAIELWQVNLVRCQIYNCYVDNTISLVNSLALPSTGIQTIRVHNNTFDLVTRANGEGYGMELTLHDAEVDHNYFIKGSYGIANWSHAMQNWDIHHNTFYAIEGTFPGDVVRSQTNGLHNVNVYNNTIEFASDKTMNVIGVYGGASENIELINNLFINNNTAYNYYPNSLVHMEGGALMANLQVKNNFFDSLDIGSVPGATYADNLTGNPEITGSGTRPDPYYQPKPGSPLIDAGMEVGFAYNGIAPDIGVFESTGSSMQSKELQTARLSGNAAKDDAAITGEQRLQHAVSTPPGNRISLYPNPAANTVNVKFDSPASQPVDIIINDSNGTLIKETTVNANKGSNHVLLGTDGMDDGTYYVKFQSADGKLSAIRIVISR